MADQNNILSFLGLCLRGGNLVVGEEPVEAVARAKDARVLLLAADAADNTRRRVQHFAEMGQCLWLRIPFTKAEVGKAVGRGAAAIVAVTDIGLANAVVHKLAELDPVHYDEAAAKLDLKAQRAAERRAEQKAHEKNLRTGKVKKKPEAPQEEAPKTEAKPSSRRPDRKTEGQEGKPKRTYRKPADRDGKPEAAYKPRKTGGSRPSRDDRKKPRAKTNPYAHSRPVKKGKGSFRKKES